MVVQELSCDTCRSCAKHYSLILENSQTLTVEEYFLHSLKLCDALARIDADLGETHTEHTDCADRCAGETKLAA